MTIDGPHIFEVKEYSRLKRMVAESFVTSETFTVGGYDWVIQFYPHGKRLTTTTYVSMFIGLANEAPNVKASCELALLDQSGKGRHHVKSLSHKEYSGGRMRYFMTKQSLESYDFLKDDSLQISCMVRVQNCIRTKEFIITPPTLGMEKDFKCLLDSGTGSDIVFRVKDDTFKAHKLILAARSPVFKAQFYGLVGNPALDEVELMDIEPSVFKAMLLFIYSDKLPDPQEIVGSMSHMIQHLLVAADRFGLDMLKQMCEAKLCEGLNVDTVATTLSLAHEHHCSQLKTVCMDFAVANLRAVIQTEGYKYIEKACPLLLSELLQKIAS